MRKSQKALRNPSASGYVQSGSSLMLAHPIFSDFILGCFSAKARKFNVSDLSLKGFIGGFGHSDHEYGRDKSPQWTIEGLHVDFPEEYKIFA